MTTELHKLHMHAFYSWCQAKKACQSADKPSLDITTPIALVLHTEDPFAIFIGICQIFVV